MSDDDKITTKIAAAAALATVMIGSVFITYRPMGWVLIAAAIVFVITATFFATDPDGGDKKNHGVKDEFRGW